MNKAERTRQGIVQVDSMLCLTCGSCVAVCPQNSLFLLDTGLRITPEACIGCGVCVRACPVGALAVKVDA